LGCFADDIERDNRQIPFFEGEKTLVYIFDGIHNHPLTFFVLSTRHSYTHPYIQAKQLKDYENAVIAKRLEELDDDEIQALVEEIERDEF